MGFVRRTFGFVMARLSRHERRVFVWQLARHTYIESSRASECVRRQSGSIDESGSRGPPRQALPPSDTIAQFPITDTPVRKLSCAPPATIHPLSQLAHHAVADRLSLCCKRTMVRLPVSPAFRLMAECVLLLLWWFPAAANQVLRIPVYHNAPLVDYSDATRPSGIFIDLLQSAARANGWTLVFVPGTFESSLMDVKEGRLDIMPDLASTPTRQQDY